MRFHEIANLNESEKFDGNASLLKYFQTRPVSMEPGSHYDEAWAEWVTNYLNEANQKAFLNKFGGDDISELDCSCYNELPPKAIKAFSDFLEESGVVRYVLHDDPENAPSWMLMTPVTEQLLPPSSWLIHFSDHAEAIKKQGFIYGVE